MTSESLSGVVDRLRGVVQAYRGQNLNEQDTKNAIIEPILAAIGWPKSDLRRVRAEYRHTTKDNPVDYALVTGSKPVVFVEAKALDRDIRDHKVISQVLSYAVAANVDWAMITNGYSWDLYYTFARVQAPKKLFFSTHVDDPEFVGWMSRLTPERLEGNDLERFWRCVFAARAVAGVASTMFLERDDQLVKLLARRTELDEAQVATALASIEARFHVPGVSAVAAAVGDAAPRRAVAAPPPAAPLPPRTRGPTAEERPASDLPRPPTGTKPTLLIIGDDTYQVSSWREFLITAIQHVHRASPERWPTAFESPRFEGQKRRYLAPEPAGMTAAVPIPGGYVEANLSARAIVRLVGRLMEHGGIPLNAVRYELSPEG